tara:strand:- start:616 stop:1668 length:1053 start_codon:yes stop_codon:yes gene_type:complete
MKSELIIINKPQFGYHTDTYYYCKYLKKYIISYISFDEGLPRQNLNNVQTIEVSNATNLFFRAYRYFKVIIQYCNSNPNSTVFLVNFNFCFLLTFFIVNKNLILDIRTSSVSKNILKRLYENLLTRINLLFFSKISIISEGLAKKFQLKNYFILPLGADYISKSKKTYNKFKLLYVGTFNSREIEKTVKSIYLFYKKHPDVRLKYDIVGYGDNNEVNKINEEINKYNLQNDVFLHGRKTLSELKTFFDKCNIGISYIPIDDYFNFQPPTKTYEYLLSGLFCIATSTLANKEIINSNNGILISDNSESMCEALIKLYKIRKNIFSSEISKSVSNSNWNFIVNNHLKKVIDA